MDAGEQLLALLDKGGTIALLVFVLIAGWRGWWVFGREYNDKVKECDSWRRLALQGTDLAHRAVALGSELLK